MLRRSLSAAVHSWRSGTLITAPASHARPPLLRRAASTATAVGLDPWPCHAKPIEEATTLPASYYTSPSALAAERLAVFGRSWQLVGFTGQVPEAPGSFVTGSLRPWRYIVVRGEDGQLRAFHNVCRHHAAAVAYGCGTTERFVCGYHGWEYGIDGRLAKAPRVKGIKDFKARDWGLRPIPLETWGPFVFLWLGDSSEGGGPPLSLQEWLGTGAPRMSDLGVAEPMVHIARRSYDLRCNWKVFCDNYLDGGYHVSVAHPALASQLDLGGYKNELHGRVSVQTCAPDAAADARVGGSRPAGYFFLHPNAMINRYGPWLDLNIVKPLGVDRCRVDFDWWLEAATLERLLAEQSSGQQQHSPQQQQQQQQQGPDRPEGKVGGCGSRQCSSSSGGEDSGSFARGVGPLVFTHAGAAGLPFVLDSLAGSHQVQLEDIALCEAVQQGLEEPAYGAGRYAPELEGPMFAFHQLVYNAVAGSGNNSTAR